MINLECLKVRYDRNSPVLTIDSLRINRHERVAIIGPSGAGKSTLLRSIKGYVRPDEGKVEVLGVNFRSAKRHEWRRVNRKIGLIYQQFHLVPRLTVLRNVLCGRLGYANPLRSLMGIFSGEDVHIALSAIREVGLEDILHQRADTLSGGEQQRVAVARMLAQQPSIILADEPVSSLDPVRAENILELITKVHAHHDTALIMSLHQPQLAKQFAQRIIGLRNGRVIFDGTCDELDNSKMEEIYRGDNIISINNTLAGSRPAEAGSA
ncbi:MAG: phosphonate ABC transporter ATP-binding protein [Verrucomicrobia bacterium]|nr:phosphonate ABC transporter ATP-binding protein [Verrucomicrobiota bacterium]